MGRGDVLGFVYLIILAIVGPSEASCVFFIAGGGPTEGLAIYHVSQMTHGGGVQLSLHPGTRHLCPFFNSINIFSKS